MAKMDELYNDIYAYCEENVCWRAWNSMAGWNGCLDKKYGSAAFTALVDAGKLEREKRYKERAYRYRIVPTGKIKELMDAEKTRREKESAEYTIAHYEEAIARRKARYEEAIKQAEEQYQKELEWETENLEKAKTFLQAL